MEINAIIFKLGGITAYLKEGLYSIVKPIDLSQTPFASLPATLIGWLGTQLASGESISDIVLEPSGQVATAFTTTQQQSINENGNSIMVNVQTPTTWRLTINATVSVYSPNGARTTVVNSESLPTDLRDGILGAWNAISAQ